MIHVDLLNVTPFKLNTSKVGVVFISRRLETCSLISHRFEPGLLESITGITYAKCNASKLNVTLRGTNTPEIDLP